MDGSLAQDEPSSSSVEAPTDLRSQLESAYEEQSVEPIETSPEAPVTSTSTDDRARDDKGRFVTKDKSPEPTDQSQVLDQSAKQPEIEAEKPIDPPASWSAEEKEQFRQLPRETQEYLVKREGERDRYFHQKTEELSQLKNAYESIHQTTAPLAESYGIPPAQVVARLVAAQQYMDRNPAEALRYFAHSYGIDLRQLATEIPSVDPGVQQLSAKIHELENYITNQSQINQQRQQQQILSSIEEEVRAFASSKDAQGNLLYEHLEKVESDMQPIVAYLRQQRPQASVQEILKEAYDKAVWASPEIRELMKQKDQQKRLADAKQKTEKAKRAGSSIVGSPENGISTITPKDLRGQLEHIYEQLS